MKKFLIIGALVLPQAAAAVDCDECEQPFSEANAEFVASCESAGGTMSGEAFGKYDWTCVIEHEEGLDQSDVKAMCGQISLPNSSNWDCFRLAGINANIGWGNKVSCSVSIGWTDNECSY